jgi:hypothetical protein
MNFKNLIKKKVFYTIFLMIISANTCIAQGQTCNTPINIKNLPKLMPILALSRNDLSTSASKQGDQFTAKIVENLIIDNNTIIPTDSIVYGTVEKVKIPKRYPLRNGELILSIQKIETPDGNKIIFDPDEVNARVISPLTKSINRRFYEAAPIRAAGYSTSIPLGQASTLNSGAVYAISVGASTVVGLITGFAVPDAGRTRFRSSIERGVDSTPIGAVRGFVAIGQDVGIDTGDGIVLNIDRESIEKFCQNNSIITAEVQ